MTAVQRMEEIYAGDRYVVYHARQPADGRAVVVKTLARGSADTSAAQRLAREYELLTTLDAPGVVKAIGFGAIDRIPALLLEPAGSRDLAARLRMGSLGVREFLDLAVQMAAALAQVHRHGIVHRDICPAKFVLGDRGEVTLVGFDLATVLSGQMPVGEVEGALVYMAPEQTGRMRRAVDHRADLYALGATFYEMLVGNPPFPLLDPVELVHAHLAQRPVSPSVTNSGVPLLLSEIVLKLLAKTPEERYQSAEGLLADLGEARRQWIESGTIRPFLLGGEDLARELSIPDRLFGREREWAQLAAALDAAEHGRKRLVLVSGKPGIGKSALVERLADAVAQQGRFAAGKCDLLRGNVPMAPFRQAFGRLIADVLAEPEPVRAAFRDRIARVVEGSGRLLTDLIPELEALLGPQPPIEESGPAETENRLFQLLSGFVHALAEGGTCVLFLDDLQWADASTWRLLAHLATDEYQERLLLVGAYRDEEANTAPAGVVAAVRERGGVVLSLQLDALELPAVTSLLVETLRSTPEQVAPIARVVWEKTGGNPLFIRRLLRFLWQADLLSYDRRTQDYAWNRARIAEVPVTENVADLLVAGMQRLPATTRRLLEVAACIGTRFDLRELCHVTGDSLEDSGQALWRALQEHFLVPVDETPRASSPAPASVVYRFSHDRVQEAAYVLLDESERQHWHLRIGRFLLTLAPDTLERRLFEVVDQLDRGAALMDQAERMRLAELNLAAGQRAKASAAYAAAYEYFGQGLRLLAPDAAESAHRLWFELHRGAAECAYLSGDHARCETLIAGALASKLSDLERAALLVVRVLGATARGAYREALANSREGLQLFGVYLPERDLDVALEREFAAVQVALAGRAPKDLLRMPQLTDPLGLACLDTLANAMTAAYYCDQRAFALFALRTFTLCLERGQSVYMPRACADYALILVKRGDYPLAHDFGRLALELCARIGNRTEEARVLFITGGFVNHWREPLRTSVQMLRTAFARGTSTGEFQAAGISAALRVHCLFAMGTQLDSVLGELEPCQAFIRRAAQRAGNDILLPYRQAVRCLKGHTAGPLLFDDEEFNADEFLSSATRVAICLYASLRLQVAFLFGDLALAGEMASLAARYLDACGGFVQEADLELYTALTCAAKADRSPAAERAELLARIETARQRFECWAANCPENFGHRLQLIAAEQARLEDQPLVAAKLYESAMTSAQREGFAQIEAIASERYGRLCLVLGLSQSAGTHLARAFHTFASWGAVAKARALEAEAAGYGIAVAERRGPEARPRRLGASVSLDLGNLLEAADALAAEVVLPRLLEKLLHLSLELAGAERGALVVSAENEIVVRATGTAIEVTLDRTPLAATDALPRSIAEHVLRTSRALVLGDAAKEGGFGSDPYVTEHGTKSVLAVPVRRASRSVGLLYLENNLSADVFTPERVEALQLLSGQIGAALHNALLVQQLENEVAERKQKETAARFLADASAALAESLDYETTLERAARLVVPGMADLCLVDVVEGDEIRPMAVVHSDPEREPRLREFRRRYPVTWDSVQPASRALRSGKPQLISDMSGETLNAYSVCPEQASSARAAGIASLIAVPLIARGRTLGAISFVSMQPRRFRAADLAAAEEFAQRAALAIDNARLYRTSEEAVRARDEFLSIASHELRTPIASLQLTVEGISRGLLPATPENLHRTCQLVNRQVSRLAHLIEQLLSVSRIQAGRLSLHLEEVDLSAVVRSAIAELDDLIAKSGSSISLQAEEPVIGWWDASALAQVTTNLLTNALKFGKQKPITVTVERVDGFGRLSVRDRGIGISEEHLPHVFERFERAVSAREYGGLGLGLFIAHSIVEALGGDISVESKVGEGATFSVELPCAKPAQTQGGHP